MDQVLPRVWAFDRFTLDLVRGSLRAGVGEIELRPKSFDVLCYLVENPGRLIPKQELHDAVWGHVAVTDDSLVQCVRELRQKLGDDTHQLIKTVSRRGYLFDAAVTPARPAVPAALSAVTTTASAPAPVKAAWPRRVAAWAAGTLVLLGASALAVIAYPEWLPASVAQLFSAPPIRLPAEIIQRIASIALEKELQIPQFQILQPREDVPRDARSFIGVWVSDRGWAISGRQLMLVVTHADRNGVAHGYLVNGPAKPRSHVAGPAFSTPFSGRIIDRTLRYDGRIGMAHATLTPAGKIEYRMAFEDGGSGFVTLDPVWTLSEGQAEAHAARKP